MRFALVVALTFGGGGDDSRADPWFGPDKIKHFFASAFVQSVSYSALRAVDASHGPALVGATLTSAAVAVGKEVHDARRGMGFSGRDLVWDAAGVGGATLLLDRTRR